MFKKSKLVLLVLVVALVLSGVSAFATTESCVAISGVSIATELNLTVADLKAMPEEAQIEQTYIYNSRAGEQTAQVKGVSLAYLLKEKAGVTATNAEVTFEASDGYGIDPQLLTDIFNDDLKYVLAYEVNGEAIDNDDILDNEEITVYRNVKEAGEFGTVFKMVNKITVGEATAATEETAVTSEEDTSTQTQVTFTDITDEYKFAETAIYELVNRGIIDGMGDGIYAPQNEFTREQFCKIMVEALGYEQMEYQGNFSDLSADKWSSSYVQAAVDNGLFKGYTDGTFKPEQIISRQEMAVVAANAAVASGKVSQEKLNKFVMEKSAYLDRDEVPAWSANAVAWLEAQNAFVGLATEKFEPTKLVNRAQAALVVFNTLFAE
ncbi:MAG: S-layer homology domain-containing protein [Sedimentibacter sp.]